MGSTDSFDDGFDALMDAMKRQRDEQVRRTQPWQLAIQPGDYVVLDDWTVIYGEIRASGDHCDATRFDPSQRYRRFGRFYSRYCPQGEPGTVWVSAIVGKLPAEQFERARSLGWPDTPEGLARVVDGDPAWGIQE